MNARSRSGSGAVVGGMGGWIILGAIFLFLMVGAARGSDRTGADAPAAPHQSEHCSLADGCKEVTDGAQRKFLLIPRGKGPPRRVDIPKIEIPVRRVVICTSSDAPMLRALGELGSIVAVTTRKELWHIDEIGKGMGEGRIRYLGHYKAIDYEGLKALDPDVVFTWDRGIIPKLKELGVTCVITPRNPSEDVLGRLEKIRFFASFYDKEKEAEDFLSKTTQRIGTVREKTAGAGKRPRVLWGGIFDKRIYLANADSWVAKMITMLGGDYTVKRFRRTGFCGTSVTLEEVYARGKDADILITCTGPKHGIFSKDMMRKRYPLLSDIRPMVSGEIYAFQPWFHQSTDRMGEIVEDVAAMLHPELFPGHKLKHFVRLKEK